MTQDTDYMQTEETATLILDDGTVFAAFLLAVKRGNRRSSVQHCHDRLSGKPDRPFYAGQLMVSYPLVGNYGVPARTFRADGIATFMESEKIHTDTIIVKRLRS